MVVPARLLIVLLLGLGVFLAAGWSVSSADEEQDQPEQQEEQEIEPADESEQPEPVDPTLLQLTAGEHLVGWVGNAVSVRQIARQHPAIESVRAWDALLQEWSEPSELTPGTGYVVTVREGEEVSWKRPLTPVKSRMQLYRGRNLVTWLGPDDWTIDRVALGIGRSLVQAEWDGDEYSPSDSESETPLPTLKRGTALWIEVSRTVNWLQPAGVMPKIVFAGDASAEVKATVRQDSVDVMNWYAEDYGVQPDGSILTVYVAADPDSLIEALKRDGRETDGILRTWYDSGGWANSTGYVVLKTEQWESDFSGNKHAAYGPYTYGRGVMAHEYYHSIQQQTSSTDAASWLVEGGADWAQAGLRLHDADTTYEEELSGERQSAVSDEAPPLNHAERDVDTWHYSLGALASRQLEIRSGTQSLLEFWRAHLPEPLGPMGRWQSKQPWQDTFEDVFGFTVDEFYDDFAAWRSQLAPASIQGRVVGPDGRGLPYVRVRGRTERLEDDYDYFDTYTDAEGNFDLLVPDGLGAQIGVDLGGCEVYYTRGALVYQWRDAQLVSPTTSGGQQLSIALTAKTCVWQISGRLVTPSGDAYGAEWVSASSTGIWVSSEANGSSGDFTITVPTNALYRLSVDLDGCRAYYHPDGATGVRENGKRIAVGGADVRGIKFVVSESLCSTSVSGQLLDHEGNPLSDLSIQLRYEDGEWADSERTDDKGRFTITVPEPGRYRLNAWINGCDVFYRRGSATTDRDRATVVKVEDASVTGIRIKLRQGQCSATISGRVLDENGNGIAEADMWAEEGETWVWTETEADGSFKLTIPESGRYTVQVNANGCNLYYRAQGATAQSDRATKLRVQDEPIDGIVIQVPQGMCVHSISGRLLNADGSPVTDERVNANSTNGRGSTAVGIDGSFSILVPSNGSYRLYVWDGCAIYLGSRGATKNRNSAKQFRVNNADVTGIEFVLPENLGAFCG